MQASARSSIHLLRALLREASYLPDACARHHFRRYIVARFRAYQPRQDATSTADAPDAAGGRRRPRNVRRRPASIIAERTRLMQRKAHKGLNYLRRANLGEAPCLERILLFAYGRMGPRKYTLLGQLLKPDTPINGEEPPSALQSLYYSNSRYLSFFDAPVKKSNTHYTIDISDRYARLRTVIRSQCQNATALGRQIKTPHLKTPINNVWERPMPIKRARNNVRRWYASTMTALLPPLPNDEWDTIQAMSEGTKRIAYAKRRIPAQSSPKPVLDREQFKDRIHQALTMDKPSTAERPAGIQRPHNLTVRFMRRLYTKILTYCCKLEWDEARTKWVAVWGTGLHGVRARSYSTPLHDDLFSGVDANGKVIRQHRSSCRTEKEDGTEKEPRKYTIVPFYVDFLPEDHPIRKEANTFRRQQRDAQSVPARPGSNAD